MATPGHCLDDVSVIVKNTSMGTVCIAGDLFEREEDILDPSLWQSVSGNERIQAIHRARVLGMADVIIPGHGPAFQVRDEYKKKALEKQGSVIAEEC